MSTEKQISAAREAATKASSAYASKTPIKKKGKVVDYACPPGRVNRLVATVCEMRDVPPKRAAKFKEIQNSLEVEAATLLRDAEDKIKAYVDLCIDNIEPQPINVPACDCGHCQASTAGRVSLLWVAERDFRRAVFDMVVNDTGRPDFGATAVERASKAFKKYESFAKVLGLPVDLENVFYSSW